MNKHTPLERLFQYICNLQEQRKMDLLPVLRKDSTGSSGEMKRKLSLQLLEKGKKERKKQGVPWLAGWQEGIPKRLCDHKNACVHVSFSPPSQGGPGAYFMDRRASVFLFEPEPIQRAVQMPWELFFCFVGMTQVLEKSYPGSTPEKLMPGQILGHEPG
ncbi:uncharacterized protein PHA67_003485 isoform 1-T1 [Liasis olivaceus]